MAPLDALAVKYPTLELFNSSGDYYLFMLFTHMFPDTPGTQNGKQQLQNHRFPKKSSGTGSVTRLACKYTQSKTTVCVLLYVSMWL